LQLQDLPHTAFLRTIKKVLAAAAAVVVHIKTIATHKKSGWRILRQPPFYFLLFK